MLDQHSTEVLSFINSNGKTTIEQIKNKFTSTYHIQDIIDFLCQNQYIKGITPKCVYTPNFRKVTDIDVEIIYCSPYVITPDGLAYLETNKRQKRQAKWDNFHKWTNTIIAALALLSAIPALILSIMQLMQK